MPYSSSEESVTCPSPVDVRSMMDEDGLALSSCAQKFVGGAYEARLAGWAGRSVLMVNTVWFIRLYFILVLKKLPFK